MSSQDAQLLIKGFDTVELTYNAKLRTPSLVQLEHEKEIAVEQEYEHCKPFMFGGESTQMGRPGRGIKFYLTLEGFDLLIKHTPEWALTARMTSPGLWQIGHEKLLERILEIISSQFVMPEQKDEETGEITPAPVERTTRLTRVDVCADYYSPRFSREKGSHLFDQFVIASKVKNAAVGDANMFGRSGKISTFTVGKKGSCEISVYDKGLEILQASGKVWFLELWKRDNYDDVWRVEVRLAKDFLKDRQIYTLEQFLERGQEVVRDAMHTRRLTEPTAGKNRSRWPLHWLWQQAMYDLGGGLTDKPMGLRKVSATEGRRDKLVKTIAGTLRAAAVLEQATNPNDKRDFGKVVDDVQKDSVATLFHDEEHGIKVARLTQKYTELKDTH